MELRHLRYFIGVAEEQHFGRAAERLHVAQPALSRQIQDLEREMGFLLFDRLPRGVRLSAAGKVLVSDARRILHDVDEAKRYIEDFPLTKAGLIEWQFIALGSPLPLEFLFDPTVDVGEPFDRTMRG